MIRIKRLKTVIAAGALVALVGCGDLLEVQDPSRYTDSDLDQALSAVAAGVEGDLQGRVDGYINNAAIMSDVMKHTGTWSGWDDIDHGLIRYDFDGRSDGGGGLLRTRFAAQDATGRFDRLEADGQTVDPAFRVQVSVTEGWVDLLLGQYFCESVSDPTLAADGTLEPGTVLSDMGMYAQAVTKLTAAMAAANAAGGGDYAWWAQAGLARAELLLGNMTAADGHAAAVLAAAPAGWQKLALYQIATLENSIVNLSTIGFNNASGIREKWWPLVNDAARLMADYLSDSVLALTELDPRVQIRHEAGVLGVDGTTDFYSQWKYQDKGADIPITHVDEMTLIRAEVAWASGGAGLTTAMGMLNGLRTAAGLSPIPAAAAATSTQVRNVLLNERFAELFMEGHRANDLHRFGLVPQFLAAGDFVETIPNRATKFPISAAEGRDNPNVADDASARCTPTT